MVLQIESSTPPCRSGLPLATYFSGPRMRWMLDHTPGLQRRAERGEVLFGTMETWLIWKLTGGLHVTDVTNASRTMLLDVHTLDWSPESLEFFGIPRAILPEVRPSIGVFGTAIAAFPGVKIGAALGDQQAALFGQTCFDPGLAKNTYGTGCFMLMNVGDSPAKSKHQLLSTVAWRTEKSTTYALEGSVFVAGAVVQWLRDSLGIIKTAGEIEALAASVPDAGGVTFVPAFVGLGAP